ncbi:hypothetical protein EDD11_001792 [Mortierella claussenii]|nr:hypothetical protein EDD11_001792 [Mortierella claussenii]
MKHIAELPSPPLSPQEDHAMGGLARAKSLSVFEDSLNESLLEIDQHLHHQAHYFQQQQQLDQERGRDLDQEDQAYAAVMSSDITNRYATAKGGFSLSEVVMPMRGWVQMQTRINSLEAEISHVTRTNYLLNQELDKVNGYLQKLTSEGGEGCRKEYEFLVQQVDLMHRQLQEAYSQMARSRTAHQNGSPIAATLESDTTKRLRSEVKELTTSLRNRQVAFQQAEENYRRKCEEERALKQTIRERETQLSGLMEKLTGCGSEFRNSISNYEELLRHSSKLEAFENRRGLTKKVHTSGSTLPLGPEDERMPGIFPEDHGLPHVAVQAGRLSVSILSCAALLATYMLS